MMTALHVVKAGARHQSRSGALVVVVALDALEGVGGGGAWVDEELDQVLLAGDGGLGVDDELEQVLHAGDGDLAVDEELGQVLHANSSSPWRCRWRCSARQAKC